MNGKVWRLIRKGVLSLPIVLIVLLVVVGQAQVAWGSGMAQVATNGPEAIGQWDIPFDWPLEGVHAILMPTGKVLTFKRAEEAGTVQWDPGFNTFQESAVTIPIFCSGHSLLSDGRLLVTGGTRAYGTTKGIPTAVLYNSYNNTWRRTRNMAYSRWYPTNLTLGNGNVMVFSGTDENGVLVDEVEMYEVGIGWTTVVSATRDMEWYPRLHLLPDGRVFHSGPEQSTQMLDTTTWTWSPVADTNYGPRFSTSSVLLPDMQRVLTLGGNNTNAYDKQAPGTATAEVIDLSEPTPAWHYTGPMAYTRKHPSTILLPDGQVLVVGGAESGTNTAPVLAAEMFDPATETFQTMAAMQQSRVYHSSALLLPDGRVIALGTDGNYTAELYSPPYLFQGARPQITGAPATITYNSIFTVTTPEAADIATVVLMRPGASTHSLDMEQRYVGVEFVAGSGELTVTAPADGNTAPPGYYMLFIVTADGVPSVAAWVHLDE